MTSALPGACACASCPIHGDGLSRRAVVTGRIDARALLGRAGEIVITHEGREYRLRFTRNGKLILTA